MLFLILAVHASTPLFGADPYPHAADLARIRRYLEISKIQATGLKRADYLAGVQGIVSHFRRYQSDDGRIADPFLHREIPPATPCYAWAAAALVASGRQPALLDSAVAAFEVSLTDWTLGGVPAGYSPYYAIPLLLAYENLRPQVTDDRRKQWTAQLRHFNPTVLDAGADGAVPANLPEARLAVIAGEFLRQQNQLTDLAYVERELDLVMRHGAASGFHPRPDRSLAFDLLNRYPLAVLAQRGYYRAQSETEWLDQVERGLLTSLLVQSPRGEWPVGGPGSQRQWTDAVQCVVYEAWANRKQRTDATMARAFKRAARLALQSLQRWVRPSRDLWPVKNHFDPALGFGLEPESSVSVENLLTASLLATAWLFADDAISEGPCPADVGGFVLELPEFGKIVANAGGLYLELETGADPEHQSTGLVRLHRRGLETLIGPTAVPAAAAEPLAVGIAWQHAGNWQPLASFGTNQIQKVTLSSTWTDPAQVRFSVRYDLKTPGLRAVVENYDLNPDRLRVTVDVDGPVERLRARFPALAFDGVRASHIGLDGPEASVRLGNSRQIFRVEWPAGVLLQRTGRWVPTRNGYVEAIEGDARGQRMIYSLQPTLQPRAAQ